MMPLGKEMTAARRAAVILAWTLTAAEDRIQLGTPHDAWEAATEAEELGASMAEALVKVAEALEAGAVSIGDGPAEALDPRVARLRDRIAETAAEGRSQARRAARLIDEALALAADCRETAAAASLREAGAACAQAAWAARAVAAILDGGEQ
jgi:hypothetical protein